ncbi:bifunctional helix-turn-helix transcriptional regulator/GNAT family N-acetyltransferase [Acetobacter sp. DsW_063]|uniref:bifunctional helix-turn-helix transcriptional regulator/GNAT family N-acetyltransferase n=1 Tax=Acetobacter sp. DsW_063 TaxID=1514894 RepID=UPI000A39858D|nr:bifunctional helix-turn-helix transcriptional regulator/GNAT family N-acetyltransferase [Acetobacter sp. DsW_063]OUJ16321.1 MarR family transcriptional regulator [Acetobacter sp. DsW_063]
MENFVASVRTFNGFYTRAVGALNARFLGADMTLGEARLLHEIARADTAQASELKRRLDMDAAQMSRMLARFEAKGWIVRGQENDDARAKTVTLTSEGSAAFQELDRRQIEATTAMLADLDDWGAGDVTAGLTMARLRLDPSSGEVLNVRPFRSGDVGMIAARQSLLYAQENGWGAPLEALVTMTAANFLRDYRPGRDACWVAELDGVMAGSVMVTDEGGGQARLRLLYVEPFARNRGVGAELIGRCVSFAKEAGYESLILWTHTVLEGARRLYSRYGFVLTEVETHTKFGEPVQGETWLLTFQR